METTRIAAGRIYLGSPTCARYPRTCGL